MSTKKRKPKTKRSGNPGHKRPVSSAPAPTELTFDRIGKPEIDRILREQIGMTLAVALERSSVPSLQAFVDELEHEDDAVVAVRELEATTEEALLLRLACDSCRMDDDRDADRKIDVAASWQDVG